MAESGAQVGVGAVGCYSLHLYCVKSNPEHKWDEFPHEYADELGSRCRSAARADGWIVNGRSAVCPKCSGKKRKVVSDD